MWKIKEGSIPLIATAIHNGSSTRNDLIEQFALSPAERLREEDPHTGLWTRLPGAYSVVCHQSRFEIDLNRPREKAVYIRPEDAWNLVVWKNPLSSATISRSLAIWDSFYLEMKQLMEDVKSKYGGFIVFDLHSYNHQREGIGKPVADPVENPEINVGTGTMDRVFWAPLVERFISGLSRFNFEGRKLDVRENVRFKGGNFPKWIHDNFPSSGCALAIEVKKNFMDEWTGKVNEKRLKLIKKALESTVPGVLEELGKLLKSPR
jgi:N-formylglutamate amidohydrolase